MNHINDFLLIKLDLKEKVEISNTLIYISIFLIQIFIYNNFPSNDKKQFMAIFSKESTVPSIGVALQESLQILRTIVGFYVIRYPFKTHNSSQDLQ
jgi:hypothetical protein